MFIVEPSSAAAIPPSADILYTTCASFIDFIFLLFWANAGLTINATKQKLANN